MEKAEMTFKLSPDILEVPMTDLGATIRTFILVKQEATGDIVLSSNMIKLVF